MLNIVIPARRNLFNEETEEFISLPETRLKLEHSLISIHKWEQKWHKPFLDERYEKTSVELLDYIRCMSLNGDPDLRVLGFMPQKTLKEIVDYINDPHTAATFSNRLKGAAKTKNEVITSETIYYWMIAHNIPHEYEKWHLEALLALIKFVSIRSGSENDKMSKTDTLKYIQQQNAINKAKFQKGKKK